LKQFLESDHSKVLENKILNHLELNEKEKYRWIALKIEIENKEKTREVIEKEIIKTAKWMNKEIYRNKVEVLKNKMNAWDSDALREYSELIKEAKKLWIK
jgi:UDP-N-acetylglucosamine:LPS N-acetylglucosamine transferase